MFISVVLLCASTDIDTCAIITSKALFTSEEQCVNSTVEGLRKIEDTGIEFRFSCVEIGKGV